MMLGKETESERAESDFLDHPMLLPRPPPLVSHAFEVAVGLSVLSAPMGRRFVRSSGFCATSLRVWDAAVVVQKVTSDLK